MGHPPYTDALIQRAITQGLDPAGEPLDWTMPRWQMADQGLNDLLAYPKTLRWLQVTGATFEEEVH